MSKLKIKHYLLLANILLVLFLIVFSHLEIMNLSLVGFGLVFLLTLAFAFYRPGWAFVLLIGSLPLEIINLAPEILAFNLRPYQILAISIGISLLIRFFLKKINFSLPKLRWFDFSLIALIVLSFLSALFSSNQITALKLSLIFSSFVFIYFIARIYLQNLGDLKRILPFFLSSSFLVVCYGILQNWLFSRGLNHQEIMPDRPNGTFQEPDWLGIFIVLIISILISLIYFLFKKVSSTEEKIKLSQFISLYVFLTLSFALLILTVSRSAWLAIILSLLFSLFAILTNLNLNHKKWDLKIFTNLAVVLISSVLISLGLVKIFNLTDFELDNRLQSSSSGEQIITVSCQENSVLPERIETLEELDNFNCRHINLEEIEAEKTLGNFVKEIKRPDPNFNIRAEIYKASWEEIKSHWFLGIGWGNIGSILGTDERGATLNASNMFLEIYLGTGILGFLIFAVLWTYIFLRNIRKFFFAQDPSHKTLAIFILAALVGLTISNLFNSGIMLGFLWVFLAVSLDKK